MSSLLLGLLLALAAGDLDGAEKALDEGQPERALELLRDLADTEEAPQRALLVAGRAYLALREYEAAVDPLLRASDRAPEDRQLARREGAAALSRMRPVGGQIDDPALVDLEGGLEHRLLVV